MFSTSKKTQDEIDTIIGPSSSIEGQINASGSVRIDGKYKGDIHSDANVIIGEQGYVSGNIFTSNLSISGRVEGNVNCKGLLEIHSTGQLIGDVEVKSISISDGAIFKGKCNMISSEN